MKKKINPEELTQEEINKHLLKVTILNNKQLKSINNYLTFFVIVFIIGLISSFILIMEQ